MLIVGLIVDFFWACVEFVVELRTKSKRERSDKKPFGCV